MNKPLRDRALKLAHNSAPPVVNWNDQSVPGCSTDDCPHYDGKRCRLLGFRPGSICEPAVAAMAELLEKS